MKVKDPVILGADEGGHVVRWQARQHVCALHPEALQIIQDPLIVISLLLDVRRQVGGQVASDGIRIGHGFGPIQRRLHEWDAGTDDAMKRDQVFGVERRYPRMAQEFVGCVEEGFDHQLDLGMKERARRNERGRKCLRWGPSLPHNYTGNWTIFEFSAALNFPRNLTLASEMSFMSLGWIASSVSIKFGGNPFQSIPALVMAGLACPCPQNASLLAGILRKSLSFFSSSSTPIVTPPHENPD